MSAKIVLLTPARRFIANRFGVGYQLPLGMVLLGGALIDAGHEVKLIDNDVYGWTAERLVEELMAFRPNLLLIGHTGATAAHLICLDTTSTLKQAFPTMTTVYGGVYATYSADSILNRCPAIDIIVRGEGEATIVELVETLMNSADLATVRGIVYRADGVICTNPQRPPIANLDQYRPGWELVDWQHYKLFGVGRSAGIQFSRGCPLTCTYCGQWMFWKKWRHRSVENFVEQLSILVNEYAVKIVWLADENFGADREVTCELLERLIAADLDLSLNINMTAADIVRDADILPLYKAAGVDYVVMGVESLEDKVIDNIRKNNPFRVSQEAVRLLHKNQIISLVNIIYGLEDETPRTMIRKFRKLRQLDADILNAVYLTPHHWTRDGRVTDPQEIIQPDLTKWTYRNQITHTPELSPLALFAGVKLTEMVYHLRARGIGRLFWRRDKRVRKIFRRSMWVGMRVLAAEIYEFIFATSFAPRGTLSALPDAPTRRTKARPI